MRVTNQKKPRLMSLVAVAVLFLPALGARQAVGFPGGVSPSDAYATLDHLDRSIEALFRFKGEPIPEAPYLFETKLGPFHVYQMLLMSGVPLQEVSASLGVLQAPVVVAIPQKYAPRDVKFIAELYLANVRRIAAKVGASGLPELERSFSDKTPEDVFGLCATVYLKLNRMAGYEKVSPNDVYAQTVRADQDVRSILKQADPACRYRIDQPPCEPDRTPTDVFAQCLVIRHVINKQRQALGQPTFPVPDVPAGTTIRPQDVFFQTQIIIAELNLLKMGTGTISSTPLAIPVTGKTPTDVHRETTQVEYLLRQIDTGRLAGAGSQASAK